MPDGVLTGLIGVVDHCMPDGVFTCPNGVVGSSAGGVEVVLGSFKSNKCTAI